MRMLDLIEKKKSRLSHTPQELAFIAEAAADGSAPDYQLSAWLMAARLNGMNEAETVAMTRAMAGVGERLDLSGLSAPKIDKHSTGGVGDGISLALAPLVASAGIVVPMMSGRGLGHTGGTLDKLESMSGFKVRMSADRVRAQLRGIGVCMFGQSENMSPADRKLYALRDVTSTVDCLPLIVGSILSKKLTEDLSALVLDIKSGSGAIFKDTRSAAVLGKALVKTSRKLGLPCVGLITGMEQPLGRMVGNALELKQAIEVLRGDKRCADYVELLLALGGWMVYLAKKARSWQEGAKHLEFLIESGAAVRKFREMVQAQGGDPRVADDPDGYLPKAAYHSEIKSDRAGFVVRLDAREIGLAAVALGAGRGRMEDVIDPGAGIELLKKIGDKVERHEPLMRLYAGNAGRIQAGEAMVRAAVGLSGRRPKNVPLIRKVLR